MNFIRMTLLVLLLTPTLSHSKPKVTDFLEYGAGIYSSIYIHEVGHALTAKLYGAENIDINVPAEGGGWLSGETKYVMPSRTRSADRMITVSGLFAANLAAEVVLQNDGLHDSAFAQSIFGTAHASNVMHVFRYYTKIRGRNGWKGNDIDHYELSGGNPHVLSAILLGYTAWSLSRASDKQLPLFGVSFEF